jgi:hypothetical protein
VRVCVAVIGISSIVIVSTFISSNDVEQCSAIPPFPPPSLAPSAPLPKRKSFPRLCCARAQVRPWASCLIRWHRSSASSPHYLLKSSCVVQTRTRTSVPNAGSDLFRTLPVGTSLVHPPPISAPIAAFTLPELISGLSGMDASRSVHWALEDKRIA